MAIKREAQGRIIVGDVTPGNDYKGMAGKRNLYIQLTSDGATDESLDALNYLKDYATYNNSVGEPIMPPDVNVWISNNGTTSAVEADDLSLEDGTYTICGITCTDGTWDFSNAGQQGGGGGSDLPSVDSGDNGKLLTVVSGEWAAANSPVPTVSSTDNGKVLTVVEGEWSAASASGGGLLVTVTYGEDSTATLDKNYSEIKTAMLNGINVVFADVVHHEDTGENDAVFYRLAELWDDGEEFDANLFYVEDSGTIVVNIFSASSATGTLTYTPGQ